MFGKILSLATRVVTLPVDVMESGLDVLDGGDGRPDHNTDIPILSDIRKIRDEACRELED